MQNYITDGGGFWVVAVGTRYRLLAWHTLVEIGEILQRRCVSLVFETPKLSDPIKILGLTFTLGAGVV